MNTARKRLVIYVFLTLLFTTACDGCYMIPGVARTAGDIQCVSEGYSWAAGTTTYQCFCPMDTSYSNRIYNVTSQDFENPEEIKNKACFDYYILQAWQDSIPPLPTEPPTEAPTEAPTDSPTEAPPPKPLLKGTVSACDTAQGYINFPLAESNPNIAGKTLGVTINNKAVNCGIPAVNTSILACPLPPGAVFPITVSVTLDGAEINNFTNDGYFCTDTKPATGGGDSSAPEEEPVVPLSCIPDPTDPYSCVD